MIIKYNPKKVYRPADFKNSVRRAAKFTMERKYMHIPLRSKAVDLLMAVPLVRMLLAFTIKKANKLIEKYNKVELLERKGEQYVITK